MGRLTENVDGFQVDTFAAAFSGTTEIEMSDARYMTFDDEILIVARVRVKVPRLKESRNGDITRVNVLGIKELALVRSEQLRKHLCETLGLEEPAAQLALGFQETEVSSNGSSAADDVGSTTIVVDAQVSEPKETIVSAKVVPFGPSFNKRDVDVRDLDVEVIDDRPAKVDPALAAFLSE